MMVGSSNPKELQERLREVLADDAFAKELLAMERPEDVQIALEEKDIELSLDEIKQIGELVPKVQNGEISQEQVQRIASGELSEDKLEEVAGGALLLLLVALACGLGVGGFVGGGIAAFGW